MSNSDQTPPNTNTTPTPAQDSKSLFDYDVLPNKPGRNLPKKMPKPHRCNDHMEDLIQGMFHKPREVIEPFKVWYECVRSEEGKEPERFQLANGRNF